MPRAFADVADAAEPDEDESGRWGLLGREVTLRHPGIAAPTLRALARGTLAALLLAAVVTGSAMARPTSSSSLRLVLLDSTDGFAHYGQRITFAIRTSNPYPVVSVTCSQGGVVIYGDSHPMYQPNPWDDQGIFTLSSLSWTSGAADCTALLKGTSRNRIVTLASTSFHVLG